MHPKHTEELFKNIRKQKHKNGDYERYWHKLHALDRELEQGCITIEKFHKKGASAESAECFVEGEKNVIIKLKRKATAEQGVEYLRKFARGSGTRFVLEEVTENGVTVPQIRTNIDKKNWARLAVFCKACFEEEVPKHARAKHHQNCKELLAGYLHDTNIAWDASEGMPVFVSIMGMHGILRPAEKYPPDRERKYKELNEPSEYGNPHIFRDLRIHVDLDRHGNIETSPYGIGYNEFTEAMEQSIEGGSIWKLIAEAFIGGKLVGDDIPMANKFLHAGVAVISAMALWEGRYEPIQILCCGGVGAIVGFVRNRWIVGGTKEELETNPEEVCKTLGLPASAAGLLKDAAASSAQQGKMVVMQDFDKSNFTQEQIDAVQRDAFAPHNLIQLEDLLRNTRVMERTAAHYTATVVEDRLAAKLSGASALGGLLR